MTLRRICGSGGNILLISLLRKTCFHSESSWLTRVNEGSIVVDLIEEEEGSVEKVPEQQEAPEQKILRVVIDIEQTTIIITPERLRRDDPIRRYLNNSFCNN